MAECPKDDKCDTCINCNAPECNNEQSYCSGAGQLGQEASAHLGPSTFPSVAKDDIIIKKTPIAVWNEAAQWASKAAKFKDNDSGMTQNEKGGSPTDSGGWDANTFTREHLYADELAELIAGIESIDSNTVGITPAKDGVIKVADILKIYEALQKLKLDPQACSGCNTACDVKCDTCDTCDACVTGEPCCE